MTKQEKPIKIECVEKTDVIVYAENVRSQGRTVIQMEGTVPAIMAGLCQAVGHLSRQTGMSHTDILDGMKYSMTNVSKIYSDLENPQKPTLEDLEKLAKVLKLKAKEIADLKEVLGFEAEHEQR